MSELTTPAPGATTVPGLLRTAARWMVFGASGAVVATALTAILPIVINRNVRSAS
jgi:hypothetical protein